MNDITIMTTVLSGLAGICAIVFGYAAFHRARKTDDTDEGTSKGVMLTELGYIKANTEDIKRRQERQEQQHIEVVTRLTAVEASAKQAHKRIDHIEAGTIRVRSEE